jgi:hypothetical protein
LTGWLQPPERFASIINAADERKAETSLAVEPEAESHARSKQDHFHLLLNGLLEFHGVGANFAPILRARCAVVSAMTDGSS